MAMIKRSQKRKILDSAKLARFLESQGIPQGIWQNLKLVGRGHSGLKCGAFLLKSEPEELTCYVSGMRPGKVLRIAWPWTDLIELV